MMEDSGSIRETWTRCAPADLYYARDPKNSKLMFSTERLNAIVRRFKLELLDRYDEARRFQPKVERPPSVHRHSNQSCSRKCKDGEHSSDSSSEDDNDEHSAITDVIEEMERKMKHPARLHTELWFNDPGEVNDGPLCRCR